MTIETKLKEKDEIGTAKGEPKPAAPLFEEDDYVCYVRRNWGTPGVPLGKVDYADRYQFTGGVARNIPYLVAKRWQKSGAIGGYILPNNASIEDISHETGRDPLAPKNIAEAVEALTPDKIIAILGEDGALQHAKRVQEIVSSRHREG